jgi:Na+/melibiose symporter-like transporter
MAAMDAPRFERVLAAEGISNFGSMLSRLAIPWLATLVLQASAAQMAALLLADVAAAGVASLWLGAWVDRSGKRRVMLLADAGRCALLLALAFAAWRGQATMAGLFVAAAISGLLTAAFELARSAWVAQQVPAGELPRRNAQLSAAGSVTEAAAFAIGGWLFQGLGAVVALAVDALSYAASALCLRGVPEVPGAQGVRPSVPASWWARLQAEALHGLQAVAAHPALRTLAGVEGLLAFWMGLSGTSYMIFVSRDVGLPTSTLGMVFALGGLGSVAGAALAPRLGRRWGPGRVMTLGLLLTALGAACLPLVPGPGWMAVALLITQQTVGDAGHTLQQVHDRTLRQTAVPPELLARADAGIRTVGHACTVAGALAGGMLGTLFNARAVLAVAAGCVAAAAVLAALRLAERRAV